MDVAFAPEAPWAQPQASECVFYTDLDLPGGETVRGAWDIQTHGFAQYIGNYPIAGKTVLDVGTASGYLAFAAEKAGAKHVTAQEAFSSHEFKHLQFAGHPFHTNRKQWRIDREGYLKRLKSSFWYSWHKLDSHVDALYVPMDSFPDLDTKFDVVIFGAIIEHLSDPITAIGNVSRLAEEAVIVAFTPVEHTDDLVMKTMNGWDNPATPGSWWKLSRGLYNQIFNNLGFDVEIVKAFANFRSPNGVVTNVERPTIIATRR